MDEVITKRLHISGLTTALTPEDLSKRMSTFGTVKSVDGFNLQDGLGQPRKFGYMTLETTTGKLARCFNLLSGSTWKGAKLRIGEAKPDFAERLAAERQAASDEPPKKRRRRAAGVYSADMSLVTPENVAGRGGWKVTQLGRIVRSVRMRPERPLPPPTEVKVKAKAKGNARDGERKKKKRVKEPDVRGRRRTIDVTRWGSVHLKGMFLDMEVVGTKRDDRNEGRTVDVDMKSDTSEEESEEEAKENADDERNVVVPAKVVPPVVTAPSPPAASIPKSTPISNATNAIPETNTDITLEKNASLSLLRSLFGSKDGSGWVGRESVGSDIDEAELTKGQGMMLDGDDDDEGFEVVPRDDEMQDSSDENEEAEAAEQDMVEEPLPPSVPATQKQQQATKLKDLFAPREEDAGFSLLGHLDLDLELDDEVPFLTTEPPASQVQEKPAYTPSFFVPSQSHVQVSQQLDAKQPLFFPHPSSSGTSTKARAKDLFDVARENRWSWRDPAVKFYRTETDDEVRKRWEEGKVELTREWKRRCREAGKVSRRRRGGDAGGGE